MCYFGGCAKSFIQVEWAGLPFPPKDVWCRVAQGSCGAFVHAQRACMHVVYSMEACKDHSKYGSLFGFC